MIDAEYIREVEPGEMIIVDENGLRTSKPFNEKPRSVCTFEHVYFSRPDSTIFGRSVNESRHKMGKQLAVEHPCDADIVVPVPDSGVSAAIGFASQSGINYRQAIIRNHYVGRTFIEPSQSIRSFGVRLKLNPIKDLINGRRVVLVDDSIVRGTTSKKIVQMVRESGAKEVHMRISCPPTMHSCYYGVDTPNEKDLIAARLSTLSYEGRVAGFGSPPGLRRGDAVSAAGWSADGMVLSDRSRTDVSAIRDFIGADSLGYLSQEGMLAAIGIDNSTSCTACWSGKYPTLIANGKAAT